ncbi:MAG: hypothetical protein FWH26_00015 [Oscillospiraceae bacterium]|nr:hypothetical protein [Oscillospiraceae bacterium]
MDIAFAKQNNERTVKTYHCTRWNFPKLDGHLTVTTERVIFHGADKAKTPDQKPGNRIVEEAEIKSVSGLSSFYGTKFNLMWFIIGLAVMIGGIVGARVCVAGLGSRYVPAQIMVLAGLGVLLGLAAIIAGVLIILLLAFQKAFFLNVYSSQSAGTPISIGNADKANHVLLSLCGKPTEETDLMMTELGAMLIDLKTDKKQAYEAWKV